MFNKLKIMKRIITICSAIILLSAFTSSYGDKISEVKMGNQIWMKEDLDVTKFRNGDIIKQATTAGEWKMAIANKQPAWCYLFFDSNIFEKRNDFVKYGNEYIRKYEKIGKIYNAYALIDTRNIAPIGWRVSTTSDWSKLNKYLMNNYNPPNKKGTFFKELVISRFKEGSKSDLESNITGFSAMPLGACDKKGNFQEFLTGTNNSTYYCEYGVINDDAPYYQLGNPAYVRFEDDNNSRELFLKQFNYGYFSEFINQRGLPIRCIKDSTNTL